jgi:uncharacterized protein
MIRSFGKTKSRCIDIHAHLAAPGAKPSKEELSRIIRLANYHAINRVVLLGNIISTGGPNPSIDDIVNINSNTLEATQLHPEFFTGFCYLNPSHPPSFIQDEIDRCVRKGGMKGIKLWIAVKATDKRLDVIMESARKENIPVLHHAWYKQTSYGFNESNPAELADLAKRHSKVTIIMAHLTGCGHRGVLDIIDYPNVILDTSGGLPESGLVEFAVNRLGAKRVIYGSDWPIRDFGVQVGRVQSADLTSEERDLIFYKNAQRILDLN